MMMIYKDPEMFLTLLGFLFVSVIVLTVLAISLNNRKIRKSITSGEFIPYKEFERNWISVRSGKRGVAGYKYNDGPGCYVITIYDHRVDDDDYLDYENIYIGQSVHVCQRIHNHFNGKGNGDVYADIKYGKYVYVRIVPCDKEEMNAIEKQLISAFNATSSYNNTRGGGRRW